MSQPLSLPLDIYAFEIDDSCVDICGSIGKQPPMLVEFKVGHLAAFEVASCAPRQGCYKKFSKE